MACLIILGGMVIVPTSETLAAGTVNKSISMLVKTKTSAEIFWIKDGMLHAFPKPTFTGNAIFKSWFPNFDWKKVGVLSDARMESILIGKAVSPKPKSMLLVFKPSDNKVYEVVGEYKISVIETEQEATEKYGEKWNMKVYELPIEYFTDYEIE